MTFVNAAAAWRRLISGESFMARIQTRNHNHGGTESELCDAHTSHYCYRNIVGVIEVIAEYQG
jgi:hypothetical protein